MADYVRSFLNAADSFDKYTKKKIGDILTPRPASAASITPAPPKVESIPLGSGYAQNAADIIQKKKKEQEDMLKQM